MSKQLIECVPNFSEGRDMAVVGQITAAIESVEGVKLLNVDPGAATNRTVVTFVGEPEAVTEAAFRAVRRATEGIDMRHHKGEHPRIGATDVLPLIPVAGISMEETAEYARRLAERIGTELSVPVYCYESAAYKPERDVIWPLAGRANMRVWPKNLPTRHGSPTMALPSSQSMLPARG